MPDEDVCENSQIDKLFSNRYTIRHEEAVSLKKNYILHLAASNNFKKIAVGSTDRRVKIYQVSDSEFTNVTPKKWDNPYSSSVCGLRFMNNDTNSVLVGTESGRIELLDLRSMEVAHVFVDDTSDTVKTITSFDLSSNDRVICAGTDQIQNDVFLLFHDIRQKTTLLGGYWESHADDVTQIKFHSSNPNIVMSGSTDGLVNVFDISNTNEEDALKTSFNTETSVQKLAWHKNVYEKDLISCITHTNVLHFYNVEEEEEVQQLSRQEITEAMRRKTPDECNIVDCHNSKFDEILVLATSNFNQGECVRGLKMVNRVGTPSINFMGNRQIVRTSLYHPHNDVFILGGESGIVSLWKSSTDPQTDESNSELNRSLNDKLKLKNDKKSRNKPY